MAPMMGVSPLSLKKKMALMKNESSSLIVKKTDNVHH
jgi:hypothetical protein